MNQDLVLLTITAGSMGFFHTLFGPDHYLPFIVMAKARKWNLVKTAWITFLCGLGHIGSSVLLGIAGIALGIAVNRLVDVESFRGNIAAWLLIGFGLAYFVWGLRKAIKDKKHEHSHFHAEENKHSHEHGHNSEHAHVHESQERINITPWVLFTIFVFGPCEPLIPILMYPAAKSSVFGLVAVTAVFGGVTILTMLSIVIASSFSINFIPLKRVERYVHAFSGGIIILCGIAIQFMGL